MYINNNNTNKVGKKKLPHLLPTTNACLTHVVWKVNTQCPPWATFITLCTIFFAKMGRNN